MRLWEHQGACWFKPGCLNQESLWGIRAEKLTTEQRFEIARKAAKARWAKKRQREEQSS